MASKCPAPKRHGAELSSAESAAPSRRRRNGGAEMALPLDSGYAEARRTFQSRVTACTVIAHHSDCRQLAGYPETNTGRKVTFGHWPFITKKSRDEQ